MPAPSATTGSRVRMVNPMPDFTARPGRRVTQSTSAGKDFVLACVGMEVVRNREDWIWGDQDYDAGQNQSGVGVIEAIHGDPPGWATVRFGRQVKKFRIGGCETTVTKRYDLRVHERLPGLLALHGLSTRDSEELQEKRLPLRARQNQLLHQEQREKRNRQTRMRWMLTILNDLDRWMLTILNVNVRSLNTYESSYKLNHRDL
ncbi:unnamed protein product [Amoebophrya sp. A25]|nr:unnamed protein product [Amoebophrya sp. A25]|eukprot:GSA25T00016980001.1